MSQLLIQKYLNELAKLRQVSGTHRESVVREAFKDLLKNWGRSLDLTFVAEYEHESLAKERRYIDGALLHTLRVPFGYWEAKDQEDDLNAEIEYKFKRGYPKTNIIFEDSIQAVLIQDGREVQRCRVDDVVSLEELLEVFFNYERPEIEAFRRAVEQFKVDLPAVLDALRAMIERAHAREAGFRKAAATFLLHAQEAINPSLTDADVREMLIQHILTGELFHAVFPGTTFHEDNNVAVELHKLEATFFTGNTKHQTLKALAPYYTAIRKAAADISTHHEKQAFLKAIYENFYKVYNPKAADRLGVVYTPNEIVRFMVEGADSLCSQHFKRSLIDRSVDILDPATGTGTFVCELIAHFAGQKDKLAQKYRHELHANEVAILPYYVANLNIEATYAAATGRYEEFPGLCFVDTLDNVHALRKRRGHMDDLFGSVTDDNVKRIRNQNSRTISVIIGNPPYNANQLNENENNKNREYAEIDKRIKETYIAASNAQKTKVYDMYARFFRWAADRLDENGILAFITNRSFIHARTFDGFRKVVAEEFDEIRIVDLGGDIREHSDKAKGNVFGILTGVAISFLVRKTPAKKVRKRDAAIYYSAVDDHLKASEKLSFLQSNTIEDLTWTVIKPNEKHDWINLAETDYDDLVPLADKATKKVQSAAKEQTIFKLYSLGVVTARDEWVYDDSEDHLAAKVQALISGYHHQLRKHGGKGGTVGGYYERLPYKVDKDLQERIGTEIKWSRAVKNDLANGVAYKFDADSVRACLYRPFTNRYLYFNKQLNEMRYQLTSLFGDGKDMRPNIGIVVTDPGSQKPFMVLAVTGVFDYHLVGAAAAGNCFPLYRYDAAGHRVENITDWALKQFQKRYRDSKIAKDDIFHYVYGVLHSQRFRDKYQINLKRDFPRVPWMEKFWPWARAGKELMHLHTTFETAAAWPLKIRKKDSNALFRVLLRADKAAGEIEIDSETTLIGVPVEAWEYKLSTRSALEWVLDQYKEGNPKDPTIRDKFNTYRFADYREQVIDLLKRVTTVSVKTQKLVEKLDANA